MFRLLHKIYVSLRWLMLFAAVGVLYLNRSLFDPLVDLVDALRISDGLEQQKSGEVSGKVTRVLKGDMFVLKDQSGRPHTIRLTGIDAPVYQMNNRAEMLRALASKTNLSRLILSNEIRVELTYTNDSHGALGLAYLGKTNVNVMAVETGIARANRDYMNGLPLKDRYALIQAERRARMNSE